MSKSEWERMNPNMAMALDRARGFARAGNAVWAQLWLNRAQSFAYVSPRQIVALNKMLNKAELKMEAK